MSCSQISVGENFKGCSVTPVGQAFLVDKFRPRNRHERRKKYQLLADADFDSIFENVTESIRNGRLIPLK